MFFDILTLFPEMFAGPFGESIIGRAQAQELLDINLVDIRDYTEDKHHTADDYPYGGGAGMVLKPEPVFRAVEDIKSQRSKQAPVIFLTPQGKRLEQDMIKNYSRQPGLTLLCGHYEGIDERIRDSLVDEEISIGDYVLTGGELPAMVFVDAVARMLPGVLGDEQSRIEDSFYQGLLDHPQYTRPREYNDLEVPQVLLSGNHAKIDRWRKKQALKRTYLRRPDLLTHEELDREEQELLAEIKEEIKGAD